MRRHSREDDLSKGMVFVISKKWTLSLNCTYSDLLRSCRGCALQVHIALAKKSRIVNNKYTRIYYSHFRDVHDAIQQRASWKSDRYMYTMSESPAVKTFLVQFTGFNQSTQIWLSRCMLLIFTYHIPSSVSSLIHVFWAGRDSYVSLISQTNIYLYLGPSSTVLLLYLHFRQKKIRKYWCSD